MGMAEVGRQDRQATLNIGALPVPLHEGLDRQAVPKVVQAGPSAVGLPTHARFAGQLVERPNAQCNPSGGYRARKGRRHRSTAVDGGDPADAGTGAKRVPWTGVPAPCVIF